VCFFGLCLWCAVYACACCTHSLAAERVPHSEEQGNPPARGERCGEIRCEMRAREQDNNENVCAHPMPRDRARVTNIKRGKNRGVCFVLFLALETAPSHSFSSLFFVSHCVFCFLSLLPRMCIVHAHSKPRAQRRCTCIYAEICMYRYNLPVWICAVIALRLSCECSLVSLQEELLLLLFFLVCFLFVFSRDYVTYFAPARSTQSTLFEVAIR
jgi:hypothetical protein